jgi:hypothetical protein
MICEWCKQEFPKKQGRFCGTCKRPDTPMEGAELLTQRITQIEAEVASLRMAVDILHKTRMR